MIHKMDARLIHFIRRISLPFARFSIFIIFFWFGILKVVGLSAASGLVERLLSATLPARSPQEFMVIFGVFEMIIGVLFLLKGFERIVMPFLLFHMFTTMLPLFLLPSLTWTYPFVPTLEGQYIIKNIVIIAVAIGIVAHLRPMQSKA